ncbi:MAG: hypothetical protein ACNS62_10235 [Candidatus Cyclobacteriaceae bacterium M3_2C_046]
MDHEQVKKLVRNLEGATEWKETHISWIIFTREEVLKIKKPVKLSFLDYSSPEKRLFYCQKELELNKRTAPDLYLGISAIIAPSAEKLALAPDTPKEKALDYAVVMNKVPDEKRMDKLLKSSFIDVIDIEELAAAIASFHQKTIPVQKEISASILNQQYEDLQQIFPFIEQLMQPEALKISGQSLHKARTFIKNHIELIRGRMESGYFRDCHGDLHTENIFILPHPLIFDCLEYNDEFRQIDLLDELAFLCMDLEFYERYDLSEVLFTRYMKKMKFQLDQTLLTLFNYYKSYRANIRAKVLSLKKEPLTPAKKRLIFRYLKLMQSYLDEI